MSKFYGKVGFGITNEISPAVWDSDVEERYYYGEVKRNSRRLENGESINDNININNTIEIIGDDYAFNNFFNIKYIFWMNSFWKISNIEIQPPRLILTIGGVYNGDTSRTESDTDGNTGD